MLHNILKLIASGQFDANLDSIRQALDLRRAQFAPTISIAVEHAVPLVAFRVGQRVKMNSKTRPKYMVGATGTVTKVNSTTCLVQLDAGEGRFSGASPVKCPKNLLDIA